EIDGNGSGHSGTSALTQYLEHNNKLYFVSRRYLHVTDGTLENTKIVGRVWEAFTKLVAYSDILAINNKLYLLFFSVDYNRLSIWESDGVSWTSEIYFAENDRYFAPSNLTTYNNSLIFCGPNESG